MTWSESGIRDMLRTGAIQGFIAYRQIPGAPLTLLGFILFRIMADESEILSLAVRRDFRRIGIASELLKRTLIFLKSRRVSSTFLEVSEANRAAIHFYKYTGFEKIGTRHNYYATAERKNYNALVLRLSIMSASSSHIRKLKQSKITRNSLTFKGAIIRQCSDLMEGKYRLRIDRMIWADVLSKNFTHR